MNEKPEPDPAAPADASPRAVGLEDAEMAAMEAHERQVAQKQSKLVDD